MISFKFASLMRNPMNTTLNFDSRYCLRARTTAKEPGYANSNAVFLFPEVCNFIGFLSYLFPSLIISRVFQRGGQQQSILFPVSAGSDVRMSPLRPNPYLSAGVEERRGKYKFRGLLRLFSRAI
jgi:hypothetical protein